LSDTGRRPFAIEFNPAGRRRIYNFLLDGLARDRLAISAAGIPERSSLVWKLTAEKSVPIRPAAETFFMLRRAMSYRLTRVFRPAGRDFRLI
jgi:hypothetical protein